GKDITGFIPPESFRWLAELETRNDVTKKLQFDLEINAFSDRGVNLEYFEVDALQHKDRESYGRFRTQDTRFVGTLTGKWHQRSFVTEETELPQAGLWTSALPLLVPRRKGGPSAYFMTRTRFGRLAMRQDELFARREYGATRFETASTVDLALDVGDVRLSGAAGVQVGAYGGRFPTAQAEVRTALITDVNANLQLHRTWPTVGGLFQLQRLRHVIDLDVGFSGRYYDDTDWMGIPLFDWSDVVRNHTATRVHVRNRLQTRAADGGIRNLLDLDLTWYEYLDDQAPWFQSSPGALLGYLRAEPLPGVFFAGEGDWNFAYDDFDQAFFGGGIRHGDNLTAMTGVTYVRNESIGPLVDVSWRFSRKYGVRLREAYDFREREHWTKLVFGRYSPDHAFLFGVSLRGTEYALQFNFLTTLGPAGLMEGRSFNDEPDPDPWSLFR
ncbi:MAG: hypothetical protein ACC662_11810, partial [Planctomycetota bacterium]